MFGIEYGDGVSIVLEREACLRETGLPPRATRKIAALKPWQPVQVVLNGYRDTPPLRMYSLQDRHLILCSGDMPEALSPARRVDLQEDLP